MTRAARHPGLSHGDRAVLLGDRGGPRGKHCTVLKQFSQFANVRFDEVGGMLVLAADLHPIPNRPRPDF
ncbi:hypothetical protein [Sphingomonas aquatilis]|uniref:hypothetical protein n=1 Tax=Sphingomonas aquatilis TaxID=93063 RepID=UPI0023F8431D|nr:hypothetical protein [Sphingomonas aquatilis]MCI4653091.1 hypothetical protein [Sphingomonas aquatilis]